MSEGHVKNGLASRKRMLGVDEQIAHLIAKGIKFEKCSEDEARAYLSNSTAMTTLGFVRGLTRSFGLLE